MQYNIGMRTFHDMYAQQPAVPDIKQGYIDQGVVQLILSMTSVLL